MAYAMGRTPKKSHQRPEGGAEVDPGADSLTIDDLLFLEEQEKMESAIADVSPWSLDLGATAAPPRAARKEPVSVRRLTGEWEKGLNPEKPKTVSPPRKANVRSKQTTLLDKTTKRRPSVEAPEKSTRDRVAEARICLQKAKTGLGESKNMRGDIKIEVTRALDRLYMLIKEAEAERKESRGKETEKEEELGKHEPSGEKKIDEEKILDKIEGNRKLLLESQRKIDEMERHRLNAEEQKKRDSNIPVITGRDDHILEKIEENNKLLKENEKRIEEIKIMVEGQRENIGKATYANVTERSRPELKSRINERRTLHSVVVTSQDDQETGEEVLDRIRKAVDAKEGWIKVERVRKAKDRKIIMGCSTLEDREKIKEKIAKAGQRLVVEDMKNKDPLLVLKDVFMMNSDDEVLRALKNQNRELFHGLGDGEDRISVKYRKKTRNPHAGHVVVMVSPTIWGRALEQGRLRIDLQNVIVEDQSPLVQCSKCLGYGHGRRFCKAPADLCSHCGGPHLGADCPEKATGEGPTCVNCKKINSTNVSHNAFSGECPVRRKWDNIARATIQYC